MTIGNGELFNEHLLIPNSNALLLIPSLSIIKLHNSSEGGLIELQVFIIYIKDKLQSIGHQIKNIFPNNSGFS